MIYREFRVPDEQEFIDSLGSRPEPFMEGESSRTFKLPIEEQGDLILSYDVAGRSVRIQWRSSGSTVIDLYREGATKLEIFHNVEGSWLSIETDVDSEQGRLEVHLRPRFFVRDQLLLV